MYSFLSPFSLREWSPQLVNTFVHSTSPSYLTHKSLLEDYFSAQRFKRFRSVLEFLQPAAFPAFDDLAARWESETMTFLLWYLYLAKCHQCECLDALLEGADTSKIHVKFYNAFNKQANIQKTNIHCLFLFTWLLMCKPWVWMFVVFGNLSVFISPM